MATAPSKQLIVVVEGTAALGPYWQTIVSDYLEKIIRSLCGNDPNGQKPSASNVELSLVVFNAHGPYSAFLVRRSGWTRDIDMFYQWLSSVQFAGGGFNDAAIAEGLSEALMMFSPTKGSQVQKNVSGQRHCILVASSNPYPLPTPVYRPPLQNIEQSDVENATDNRLSDAETLAKSFPQCSISLSVICPKQLSNLRAIFNSGNPNPRAVDLPVDSVKNPHFMVLISENFIEACAAVTGTPISKFSTAQAIKVDATSVASIVTTASTITPTVPGPVGSRPPNPVGNMPPTIVKIEPTTVPSINAPTFTHSQSVPRAASQPVTGLQTSSPMSLSQDMMVNNETALEMKPVISTGIATPLRPVNAAAANVKILNDVAQARQALAGGTSLGLPSIGGTPILSNMISSAMTSASVAASGNGTIEQNSAPASFNAVTSGTTNLGMSPPLTNLQGGVSMGQTLPVMSQGNLTGVQMVQSGLGLNDNMMNNSMGTSMASGNGTMMPTPGMSQPIQSGLQSLTGNSSNNMTNMSLSQQTSNNLQSAQSKYVRVWEGNLSGQRQGQPVFITRLEGYRSASASETLAANWPPTMQIVRLISQDHMNNKHYVGKADFLVFRAMNQHGFLGQLQEKKLCAVIQLPSQTLLLSVSDKACRLIGMLFPGDMVVFKPQIPGQPQQQHQQQLQAQHSQLQPQSQQQQQPQQQQQQQPQQQMMQQQQPQSQQQQMVGSGIGQTYMQGGPGRSQMLSQGQVSSQGLSTMPGGGTYLS